MGVARFVPRRDLDLCRQTAPVATWTSLGGIRESDVVHPGTGRLGYLPGDFGVSFGGGSE